MENHFQSWHKVTNIAWIDITLMSLLQYLDTFLSTFMYLKSQLLLTLSTKFTGKHLRWGLFYNKAAGWRPVTSLNTESGTGAFLWIFWNLYKNIYFANVCEGMPLKSKIFTGVSFRKILGFYYKQKRQLFHYEGTPS